MCGPCSDKKEKRICQYANFEPDDTSIHIPYVDKMSPLSPLSPPLPPPPDFTNHHTLAVKTWQVYQHHVYICRFLKTTVGKFLKFIIQHTGQFKSIFR